MVFGAKGTDFFWELATLILIMAILAGLSVFLYWDLSGQSLSFAMARMVTVMVICCPHALGLAVPLVVPAKKGI